jgi:hypothetical protein
MRVDHNEEADYPHLPLCPGCARPVRWSADCCPHCGEEFEAEPGPPAHLEGAPQRRDCDPHRGGLVTGLANASLILAGVSLCLFGATAIIGVPLGIAAWIMAETDLGEMRQGRRDRAGYRETLAARNTAIGGVLLSLFFAGLFLLMWLGRF